MECTFLWLVHHPIQVLWSLVWSVLLTSFQANLFLGPVPTWLQETRRHRLPVQGWHQAHAIALLSYWYPLCLCSKRWCRQHRQHKLLWFQQRDRDQIWIVPIHRLQAFQWCTSKMREDSVKVHKGSSLVWGGPILRILRETQRHFNINIFTWFKFSMKENTEDIALLWLQSKENLQNEH